MFRCKKQYQYKGVIMVNKIAQMALVTRGKKKKTALAFRLKQTVLVIEPFLQPPFC